MTQLPIGVPAGATGSALRLDRPFTPAMARRAGLSRAQLGSREESGSVRQLLRGVYVVAGVPETPELRARAVALLARGRLATARTAAWIHGADLPRPAGVLPPLDLQPRAGSRRASAYRPEEVGVVAGQAVTSPARTVADLAGRVSFEQAVGAADALLRNGRLHYADLARAASAAGPGRRRLRKLAAYADGRAESMAESALRLCWLESELPTPLVGHVVAGVRLGLALPGHCFGLLVTDEERPRTPPGWRVVVLDEERVLRADQELTQYHLVREFREHLLRSVA